MVSSGEVSGSEDQKPVWITIVAHAVEVMVMYCAVKAAIGRPVIRCCRYGAIP